ncbi:unnamed protein product [Spirodela intermedia]|uniref:Cytochrome b561 domain-containing protein n=1 Tax=Spirodela intermedia TaxID=51605 RepID=A0A7I8J663_SPIIN|nr:unnamed protein product [Spirodela intermedia]CAA6665480.1 unnamed protein product [Spirodela intermedia]
MGALLVGLARVTAAMVAALVIFWALSFQTSFLPVLHPLLMVIGFILLTGEAILAHRTLGRWSRGTRKSAHLALQGAAFSFGIFGIWAKFRASDGLLSNFLSLHSWMGLLCLSLFAAQLLAQGEGRRTRGSVLPWHVFVGLYTYGLAVATAETGLLEKLTFLQAGRGQGEAAAAAPRSAEAVVVNALGVGLALLCGVVVLAAVSPKSGRVGKKTSATAADRSNGDCAAATMSNGDDVANGHHHHRPYLSKQQN